MSDAARSFRNTPDQGKAAGHRPPPPSGLLKWMLDFPATLYRAHLGWLLTGHFLMLHHVGRKSGNTYETVVEVVSHDRERDRWIVASGWGPKAQWYQNLRANPRTTITVGARKFEVKAVLLSPEEGKQYLADYIRRYPVVMRMILRALGYPRDLVASSDLVSFAVDAFPLVAFDPVE